MVVPEGELTVNADGRRASLAVHDAAIVDQPRWPAHDMETYAARTTFRIEWTATDEAVNFEDPVKQFRFAGWRAESRLEAQVEVPALHFSWRSDPIETSSASFGIIGEEANGRYFSA